MRLASSETEDAEKASRLAPPVLGAFTALIVFVLARRLAEPLAGWTAGLLLAALPAAIRHAGSR